MKKVIPLLVLVSIVLVVGCNFAKSLTKKRISPTHLDFPITEVVTPTSSELLPTETLLMHPSVPIVYYYFLENPGIPPT